MFNKRVRGLSVGLLTLAIPLVLIAAACADDGEEATTVPADTPTADGGEASPAATGISAIGAVAVYVTETGLDDETFDVSETINCSAFVDVPAEEKFSGTSGVMEVWVLGTETTWELSMELQNLSWVVTGAQETTS